MRKNFPPMETDFQGLETWLNRISNHWKLRAGRPRHFF